MTRSALVLAALILAPGGAMAEGHPALQALIPLYQVLDARNPDPPGYDVGGIRCAGLYYAQDTWRQQHGGRGPTPAELAAGEVNLQRAVQYRVNEGLDLTEATRSTEDDLLAVHGLYLARFREIGGGAPWDSDPVLRNDHALCGLISG